jgi:hypothetical protein
MSDLQTNLKVRNAEGNLIEVPFHVQMYAEAASKGLTLSQHLNQKYGESTDLVKYGDVLQQAMLHSGMLTSTDHRMGMRPPSMKEMLETGIQLGSITRGDGSDRHTVAGRMLYPEILMRAIESKLRDDYGDLLGTWASFIAQTQTVTGPKFDQPIINITRPQGTASSPIAQLAEPDVMLSITTSDRSNSIPTKSIGLLISDQAAQASTLDLVNLAMTAQARQERVRMVEGDIAAIVAGDVDRGETAKTSFTADSLDAAGITAAGQMTHKAWVKYMHKNRRQMMTLGGICDLDTAMAIEARSGKPTRDTVFVKEAEAFNQGITVDNLTGPDPRILIVDDGVIAANTFVGLDTRFALRRVINISAQYSAIEQFVLRRATAFRVDYGEITHTLYTDAFKVMTLTV